MAKKNNFLKSFMVQGTILAIAGVLVRIIGLIYRIPLTGIIGDEGNGYYSTAYDYYSLLLLISSMSMPIAVSKLVSQELIKNNRQNVKRIFRASISISLSLGLLVFIVLFFGSQVIAGFSGYPAIKYALRALAPVLILMAIVGTLRGYMQGYGTMIPTAISQIFEQIVNAIVSVLAAYYLFRAGAEIDEKTSTSYHAAGYGAAGGTLGTLAGAFTAMVTMIIIFGLLKKSMDQEISSNPQEKVLPYKKVYKMVALTIIPVLLSTTIYNCSNLIDSTIFGNAMKFLHYSEKDRSALWGVYSGKYRLLSNVAIAFSSALSSSMIPSLVKSYTTGNRDAVQNKIASAVKLTMIIAMPCGVGLMVLGSPILKLLWPASYTSLSGYLMGFSLLTVFSFSLSTITNSALQGVDRLRLPVKHAAISLMIHLILIPCLLLGLHLGLYGVLISDIFFALVVCFLNQRALRREVGYKQEYLHSMVLPFVCSLVMGLAAYLCYCLAFYLSASNTIATLLGIIVAVVVYGISLLKFRVVDEETLASFPKGDKLLAICKKVHLL